jgi:hypothetical protein
MAKSGKRTKVVTMPWPPSTAQAPTHSTNSNDTDIAKRAFELYCERGCQDGHDVEDWLQAERELQKAEDSTAA